MRPCRFAHKTEVLEDLAQHLDFRVDCAVAQPLSLALLLESAEAVELEYRK